MKKGKFKTGSKLRGTDQYATLGNINTKSYNPATT